MPLMRSRLYRSLLLLLCFSLLSKNVAPLLPVALPVYADTASPFRDDDASQLATASKVDDQPQVAQVNVVDTPPLLAAFPAFPNVSSTNTYAPATQANTTLMRITDTGFSPPTITSFGPTDVTWVNETNTTHTLRSGDPGATPSGGGTVFLPLVAKGSPSAVAAAMTYLQELRQQVGTLSDFSATIAPGQSFTYRFTKVGQHKFHLATAPQFTGELTLSGTAILRTSPSNGEDGVASTRETILEFSDALDPATVTATAFTAQVGAQTLDYRLNLSPDKTRVTLFYNDPLPGSTRVRVTIDGNQLKDAQGTAVDVDGNGVAGGSTLLEFDTLSLTVVPGTKVCGRVFASELAMTARNVSVNTPLAGVTISVAGRDADLNAKTDANGNFCLDPAPAGRFFVHIDGRTATNGVPAGAYYPFVGKLWQSTPSQQTNVGDAYLPLVVPGTLQTVSAEADTLITFPDAVLQGHPEFDGVMITVPANALFNDDGSRGGKVGIAPVPPDRLPGELPEGLAFPVVITVQTDGAENFDTPAPVCFPNLPDPNSGETLQPGAKDALFSFNHDTGAWEAVGPMTVTQDGRLVCTDPGVGIRAPGWHGNGPPPWGPPPSPPPCNGLSVTGSSTNQEQCPPQCNPEKLKNCQERAARDLAACTAGCQYRFIKSLRTCISPAKCVMVIVSRFVCTGGCASAARYWGQQCKESWGCGSAISEQHDTLNDTNELVADNTPINDDDEKIQQIEQINQQINELLYPYVAANQEVPQTVEAQINTLLQQADNIGGGDALRYLQQYIILQETSVEMLKAKSGESLDNLPPYPLFYMAVLDHSGKQSELRGETLPYGQYTLFVPRNGNIDAVYFYDPVTHSYGIVSSHLADDTQYRFGRLYLQPVDDRLLDYDNDGAVDLIEIIYGSNLNNPDTDGDGINDGAEIAQGTDPLGGFISQTGIIGSVDTPGTAVDLCIENNLAVVADAEAGVTVFNIFDNRNPILVAQVDTPGSAQRVACGPSVVAVADTSDNLLIIDLTNLNQARIVHRIDLKGRVNAVHAVGNTIYAGTSPGRVVAVDAGTGTIVHDLSIQGRIHDLARLGEYLYVISPHQFHTIELRYDQFVYLGSTASPGNFSAWDGRIVAGNGVAYVTQLNGYNTISLANPAAPLLIKAGATQQFGWKQLVVTGSGMGVATVGLNSTNSGTHHVSLYDVSDPQQTDRFLTQFETPGIAAAVALHNGIAYVADSSAGLHVINYQAYDSQQQAPTLTLFTNFTAGVAEEKAPMRITANAADDVQVRNVEFYIDGILATTDYSFPYEYRFTTPEIVTQPTFTLRARAVDTGGNESWTEQQTITLVKDDSPIKVTNTNDSGPGSLRQTIAEAQSGDRIGFSITGAILLTSPLVIDKRLLIHGPGSDLLTLNGNNTTRLVEITPTGTAIISGLTFTGGRATQGGAISNSGKLTLRDSLVTQNTATSDGGGIYTYDGGTSQGALTLHNTRLISNTAQSGRGGGLYHCCNNYTTLTIQNSLINGNIAQLTGGGIHISDNAKFQVTGSTIARNQSLDASACGGGIRIQQGGSAVIESSTISQNVADLGGGLASGDTVRLVNSAVLDNLAKTDGGGLASCWVGWLNLRASNSTIAGNIAEDGQGGGIFNTISLELINSTVAHNQAHKKSAFLGGQGGGIATDHDMTLLFTTIAHNSADVQGGGIAGDLPNRARDTFKATIVANNIAPSSPDFYQQVDHELISLGYNLLGSSTGNKFVGDQNNDLVGIDPRLGPLANNGGPTLTLPLQPESPAINRIPINACTDLTGTLMTTDQRDKQRPQGNACDIGAYEAP